MGRRDRERIRLHSLGLLGRSAARPLLDNHDCIAVESRPVRVRGRFHILIATSALLAVFVLVVAFGASGAGSPKTVRVSVPASTVSMTTSVKLVRGEAARITATGTISYGSGDPRCQGIPITPDGCAAETAAVPGPAGALVVKVGAGAAAIAGRSTTVTGPGTISLGINDWPAESGNNTGAFQVTIRRGITPSLPELPAASEPKARPLNATNYEGITVTRGGVTFGMTATSTLEAGDVVSTDGDSVLTLEFAIGGRLSLTRDASVRIDGDRQAQAVRGTTELTPSTQPLQIQTNGGILGIRG